MLNDIEVMPVVTGDGTEYGMWIVRYDHSFQVFESKPDAMEYCLALEEAIERVSEEE